MSLHKLSIFKPEPRTDVQEAVYVVFKNILLFEINSVKKSNDLIDGIKGLVNEYRNERQTPTPGIK